MGNIKSSPRQSVRPVIKYSAPEFRKIRERLQSTIEQLESSRREIQSTRAVLESSIRELKTVRVSEVKYRKLIESSPYCIFLISSKAILTAMNSDAVRMSSKYEKVSNHKFRYLDLVNSLDQEHASMILEHAFKGKKLEFEFRGTGNQQFRSILAPVHNANGKVDRLMWTILDFTKHKNAEIAWINSEQRFRDFACIASDYFWEMDAELQFSYVSEGHEKITGLLSTQIIGKTREVIWRDRVRNSKAIRAHLETIHAHQQFEPLELKWVRPDGKVRILDVRGKPLFNESGEFEGYRGVVTDTTSLRRIRRTPKSSSE